LDGVVAAWEHYPIEVSAGTQQSFALHGPALIAAVPSNNQVSMLKQGCHLVCLNTSACTHAVTDLSREIIVVHRRILFGSAPLSPIMMPLLGLQDAQVPILVNRDDPLVGRANDLKSLQLPVAAEIRLGQFSFVLADVVNHSTPIMVNTSMIHSRANLRHGDAPPAHLFFRMERKAKPPDEYRQWRPLDFWTVAEDRELITSVHFLPPSISAQESPKTCHLDPIP
jgi:hypothetical protein